MESFLDISLKIRYDQYGKFLLHRDEVRQLDNRLEELRKRQRLTQEELANQLEVSRQTISSIENGRYNPSLLLAFRIADVFSVKIEEIFIYKGE